MKKVCVFYYGAWSSSIRDRLISAVPKYVVLDGLTWPGVSGSDVTACKNAGITMCAYVPTGGMRGFIYSVDDNFDKTPSGISTSVDAAQALGFNGIYFDEGGLYTPVAGQSWQDSYFERYLASPGTGANGGSPPILSIVGNSKYNATTAAAWSGLTCETYINYARVYSMFVFVGFPDEDVRSSRLNSNIFGVLDAVLTSETYNTRPNGLAPTGQEVGHESQCFELAYNGSYDSASTNSAIGYGLGAAYCCASMGTLASPAFENYMAAITSSSSFVPIISFY